MSTSHSSLSEEELGKKSREALDLGWVTAHTPPGAVVRYAEEQVSAILRQLEEALALAEKFEKEAWERKARLEAAEGERDDTQRQLSEALEQLDIAQRTSGHLRGERDRLREALWAQKQAEERVWRLIDERDDVRETLREVHDAAADYAGLAVCLHDSERDQFDAAESRLAEALVSARAALSTGDRQEQHLGGTGEAVAQPFRDGQDRVGDAPNCNCASRGLSEPYRHSLSCPAGKAP